MSGERFVKVFPFNLFPVNTFPMKATICLLKFCLSKFVTCSIRQVLSDFSTIKVLRYMVADGRGLSNTVSWVTVKGEQGNVSFAIHFTVKAL